jgi:hypothetical protein
VSLTKVPPVANTSAVSGPDIDIVGSKPPAMLRLILEPSNVPPVINGNCVVPDVASVESVVIPHSLL